MTVVLGATVTMGRFNKYRSLLIVPVIVILLLLGSGDLLMAKKIVACLLLPIGLLWLTGLVAVVFPGVGKRTRIFVAVAWVAYTLAGSGEVSGWLLRSLERPYYQYEVIDQKLDALVVLGGGSARTPFHELPAVGSHGDRLVRAARLYHGGKVGTLISTGRSVLQADPGRSLASDTSTIWQELGIPAKDVVELSEPTNTADEMAAVAALLNNYPDWERIGLCSSAFHLNRSLKEARKQGLDPIPVPSDFRSGPINRNSVKFSTYHFLPQGASFRNVHIALWEYLGGLL